MHGKYENRKPWERSTTAKCLMSATHYMNFERWILGDNENQKGMQFYFSH